MNIYLFEIKKRIASTLIWMAGVAAFLFVFYSIYETMSTVATMDVLSQLPEAFLKAFGMHADMSTVLGYTAMVGVYLALFSAIFGSSLGLNAVHVEERDMTADFLISKPVTRNKIMTAKILAGATHMLIFTLSNAAACYGGITLFTGGEEYSVKVFLLMMLGLYILQIVFYVIGLFISVALKKMASPLALSMGISFGFFVLNSFDTLLEDTFIKYLIPYDYFQFQYIIDNAAFKTYGLIISLALIAILMTGSYVLYNRRNIATAM